jgi:hypothetical protein
MCLWGGRLGRWLFSEVMRATPRRRLCPNTGMGTRRARVRDAGVCSPSPPHTPNPHQTESICNAGQHCIPYIMRFEGLPPPVELYDAIRILTALFLGLPNNRRLGQRFVWQGDARHVLHAPWLEASLHRLPTLLSVLPCPSQNFLAAVLFDCA